MRQAPDAKLSAYSALESRYRRLALIGDASGMLAWDRAAIMPRGGAEVRAEQLTELGLIRHELITDPALADFLDQAEAAAGSLDAWQRANLAAMRRKWRHANAVPAALHEASMRAGLACEMAWRDARPANDFASLKPLLDEVVRLTKHRSDPAHLEHQPFDNPPSGARLGGHESTGFFGQIHQNRAGLHQRHVVVVVYDRRDLVVWADLGERLIWSVLMHVKAAFDVAGELPGEHAQLVEALREYEKSLAPEIAEQERKRLETIAKAKAELEAYESEIAPREAELDKQAQEAIAQADAALMEYEANLTKKLAEWEARADKATPWVPLDPTDLSSTSAAKA